MTTFFPMSLREALPRGNPDNKKLFTKYKLTQHFFDRKETLHKETLSLISARYLFVISRLLKFQNSDKVLKHWIFLTQTSKTTNTLSNMLDLFFYKFFMIFTGSPRSAVLDLLHKKQSLISQLLSFAMFFATSGSLAPLDSTLRKSARDDDFFFQCHCEKIFDFRGNPFRIFQN